MRLMAEGRVVTRMLAWEGRRLRKTLVPYCLKPLKMECPRMKKRMMTTIIVTHN
jgi:hypothetical protein